MLELKQAFEEEIIWSGQAISVNLFYIENCRIILLVFR